MRGNGKKFATALALTVLLMTTGCAGPSPIPGDPSAPDDGQPPADEEQETSADAAVLSPVDEALDCLVGTWEVDPASEFWEIPAGDADEVSGTFFIMFDEAGGFGVEYQNWRIHVDVVEDFAISEEVVWDGMVVGEYAIGEDGLVDATVTQSEANITTVMTYPERVDTDVMELMDPIPMFYRCDGDQLFGFAKTVPDSESPLIIYNISSRP